MKKSFILSVCLIMFSISMLSLAQEPNKKGNSPLPDGYVAYNDLSDCPVKILGYRIESLDSNETTVRLLLKNTSDLPAVGCQGTFELFDSEGKSINSVQGDPIFLFKDQKPLPTGSKICEGTAFTVEEGHSLKSIKPQITQVLFTDQSIWRGF
ncbi:MAG TPA: hypothetical protein VHR47_01235 [Bacillota bacterium]|nr:hypothetical protein [Bacillota bacterium]